MQVLVYIGAVIVLFLFGIMLTPPMHPEESLGNDLRWPAAAASLFLAGILGGLLVKQFHGTEIELKAPIPHDHGHAPIFSTYIIPFEVVGVLLLARAGVGAVVLARRD